MKDLLLYCFEFFVSITKVVPDGPVVCVSRLIDISRDLAVKLDSLRDLLLSRRRVLLFDHATVRISPLGRTFKSSRLINLKK